MQSATDTKNTPAALIWLKEQPLACIEPLPPTHSAQGLKDAAATLNHHYAHIDLSAVQNLQQALNAAGAQLDFPDYYGANLDAFYDCLTDEDCFQNTHGAVVILELPPNAPCEGGESFLDDFLECLEDAAQYWSQECDLAMRCFKYHRQTDC